MTHNLFIPINNLKHNINKEYLNIDIIYSIQLNEFIHNIDDTKLLIEWFYKNKHNNDKLNININNTKYITHNEDGIEYIIGIQLNYGDFIPVKKINILDYNLEITDKLEGYISYTNRINNFDTSKLLTDLDKDEVNNIKHYEDFTKYIANILYNINSIEKKQIVDLIYSKNKSELLIALNNIFKSMFNFVDKMDTMNWISNDYTIQNILNNNNNLFNITKNKYNAFMNILLYDLLNNNYKKKMILNNLYNLNILSKDENEHIQLDELDINEYIINKLYNNILSDNFYHNLGININKNDTIYKNNKSKIMYCEHENYILDDDNNEYIYYDFKPILNNSDIIYTNCIYYHLGKHVFKYKKDFILLVQQDLINILIEKIQNNFYKLSEIILIYTKLNKTHIYNNIKNINDLENIILSSNHILTTFDLLLFSEKYNKLFIIYNGNNNPMEDYSTIGNLDKVPLSDGINLIEKNYYNINIYYYVINIKLNSL